MIKLWVDDLRMPPDGTWEHAETSDEAIITLASGEVTEMSLDHDLGGEYTTRPIVIWLCYHPEHWPAIVRVHSMNPVGRDYLLAMIRRYKPSG
jgi:hypothetical protein